MNDADRAATRDAIRRRWEAPTPDYGIRMSKMAPSQYAATQALADDLLQARKDLAALLDENERLREALERVIGMCDVPERCRCGRPNGLGAVVFCARKALAGREGV